MGRVIVNQNPMNAQEFREYSHSGPFIDFLQDKFPSGFHGEHFTSFNFRPLKVEDYDTVVGPDDAVIVAVLPGYTAIYAGVAYLIGEGIGATVVASVLTAVVAAGVSYGLNALFGPKASKASAPRSMAAVNANGSLGALGAPGSTYSLSGALNTVRIGQTIPVAYGYNPLVPDVASQPYTYYEGNEQYMVLLLCLGQGRFNKHEIRIADTNIESLSADIISAILYPPEAHGSTFGVIQNGTGRYENVATAAEVSDQELTADSTIPEVPPPTSNTNAAEMWNGYSDGVTAAWFNLGTPAQAFADAIANGVPTWMRVWQGPNRGVWRIWFIYHSRSQGRKMNSNPEMRYTKGHLDTSVRWVSGSGPVRIDMQSLTKPSDPPPEEPDYSDISTAGTVVGPFAASPVRTATSTLMYDLVFPGGGFRTNINTGEMRPWTFTVVFTAYPINDNGDTIGGAQTYTYTETLQTNTPQRRTVYHSVPYARYKVSAQRITKKCGNSSAQTNVHWTALRSVLGNTSGGSVYGDVTLLSVKIKATDGIASDAHQRIRVMATRSHPETGADLTHPVDAFKDILHNPVYGAGRPYTELDLTTLDGLKNGLWAGKRFDAVFDQPTTVWDALGLSIQMRHAVPVTFGAVVSIVCDVPHYVPSAVLTSDQIVSLSKAQFFFSQGENDGVEGEFSYFNDNSSSYAIYPPYATNPESAVLWGCRNYDDALAYVTRYWKQKSLRRQMVTVETELDGRNFYVGQCISIYHPLLGDAAVMVVLSAIKPSEGTKTTLEAYLYVHEVYE